MNETKHTKVPWVANGSRVEIKTHKHVTFVMMAQNKDDANLASSAPDLLEALELIMEQSFGNVKSCGHDKQCSCGYDKARQAIKKAGGE